MTLSVFVSKKFNILIFDTWHIELDMPWSFHSVKKIHHSVNFMVNVEFLDIFPDLFLQKIAKES